MKWLTSLRVRQGMAAFFALFCLLVVLDELEQPVEVPPLAVKQQSLNNVSIVKAEPVTEAIVLHLLAQVLPVKTTEISARVAGKVVKINASFDKGRLVRQDELLVKIDDSAYRQALAQAKAAALEAELNLKNQRTLFEASSLKIQLAEAELAAAKLQLQQAEFDLASTHIRMPFVGELIELKTNVGEYLNPGQSIASALPDSDRRIQVAVSERQFARLNLELNANLSVYSLDRRQQWLARLSGFSRNSQQQQRLVYLTVAAADSQALLFGQQVKVALPFEAWPNTVKLPGSALTTQSELYYLDPQDRLQKRQLDDYILQDPWLYFAAPGESNLSGFYLRYPRPSLLVGMPVQVSQMQLAQQDSLKLGDKL